tara:strand:- start:4109 stop:4531 length:423 start_codon:yes stop_codon:yes gene_type:complete
MKIKTILLSTLFISLNSYSQNWDYNEDKDTVTQKNVAFMNTEKIDDLLDKKRRIDRSKNLFKSFRIQLFSGSRSGSTVSQAKFKKDFPGILVETSYEQPYFKTKVGAYRTRLEAERALLIFQKSFGSAFIFEEKVTLDKL